MRRVGFLFAFALALWGAPPAFAQSEAPSVSLDSCVAAAGVSRVRLDACKGAIAEPCIETPGGETTAGLMRCYVAETEACAVQLDAAFARAQADDARAPFLAQSQEAWAVWRQAECRYQASLYEGGSLARVLAANCSAAITADRAIALIYAERTAER